LSGQKFRRGGAGRILAGETGVKVQLLLQCVGDIAALAEMGNTKKDIATAFPTDAAGGMSGAQAGIVITAAQAVSFSRSPTRLILR
jgi:hypothetical protein